MRNERILIAYYSRTGSTRTIAHALAAAAGGATVAEIMDTATRSGWRGFLRCSVEALFKRTTKLLPFAANVGEYDLVAVGTPIWFGSVSSPVRTFLLEHAGQMRRVAFFLTCDSSVPDRAFRQMREICGQEPVSVLAVRGADIAHGTYELPVQAFAGALMWAAAPPTERSAPAAVSPDSRTTPGS